MPTPDHSIHRGATKPSLVVNLTQADGTPYPLADKTVTFSMAPWKGGPLVVDAVAASVTDEATGEVTYSWSSSDETRYPGYHWGYFLVTGIDGAEGVPDGGNILIHVVEQPGDAG